MVLTGVGALLNAIKEFTEFKAGLSERIGNPEEKIIHKQDSKINNPIYSTALGLMVMGVEKEEEDIIKTYEENENSKTTDSTETERKRKTIRSTTKYGTWDKVKALIDTLLDDVDEKEEEDDDDDFDN